MESYRAGSGHEIALLTVPDLGGEPIERFALAVGRAWGIGDAKATTTARCSSWSPRPTARCASRSAAASRAR